MQKRQCDRFSIPGTTLYYKNRPGVFRNPDYPDHYFPVLNLSKGGVSFLCNERLKAGKKVVLKIEIPGVEKRVELSATIRWISKNREQSYKYQAGAAFNSYGDKKNQNPPDTLALLTALEPQ